MKDILVYVGVFVVSFILINGTIFFLLKDRIMGTGEQMAQADSTLVAEESVDSTLIDTTIATIDGSSQPLEEYNNLMQLRKRLIQIYSDGKIHDYSPAEIDSTLHDLIAQVDTLAASQQRYIRRINKQQSDMRTRDNTIVRLNQKIKELEENISQIRNVNQKAQDEQSQQESMKSLKMVAETFEAMDPESAVEKMLALPDDKIIRILKLMSERKRAKIMEVLPNPRATIIVRKMTESQ